MLSKLDACISNICLIFSVLILLYKFQSQCRRRPPASAAYILRNRILHSRLLPVNSKHTFNYQTISLLVPLKALECHALDLLGGWVFSYGGLYGRLSGIRPDGYLTVDANGGRKRSIMEKLRNLLNKNGYEGEEVEDAWMMTMPSYLGWEGINPLTVYFVYKPGNVFWLVVLEVSIYQILSTSTE